MGKNRQIRPRCNGKMVKQFLAIAWSCWLFTLIFTCEVQAGKNYTITATAGSNGSISPPGAVSVPSGGSQAFTITPSTGYHVLDVKVDNISQGAITSYTFTNVRANHTIAATFAINTYTLTAVAWSGGTISPATATVNHGSNQSFTITPNTGYYVADVAVDGVSQGAITSYSFTNVTANHMITAAFANNIYTITATAGSNGAVTPATATVNHGSNQTFTITPNTGYQIAFVMVDGVSKGAMTSYTFANVAANHTISAIFTNNSSPPSSSLINYFYDDLGRLVRAVVDTVGVIYQYDELGNLVSTTNSSTTNGPPVITGINPNILFMGSPLTVTITGQNLLSMESVTSINGLVSLSNVTLVSDTQIMARMTPLSMGVETIKVTSRNGSPNTAQVNIPVSKLFLNPAQLAISPGTSGTITATISPSPPTPMTVNLNNGDPSIATLPQTVTVPTSGSADITVTGLQLGVATIDANGVPGVVFVENPFSQDCSADPDCRNMNGLSASMVSFFVASTPGNSPSTAMPVSMAIASQASESPSTAMPVSIAIAVPGAASPSVAMPVSIGIATAATASPSTAAPVSILVASPPGNTPTIAPPVSMKIQ